MVLSMTHRSMLWMTSTVYVDPYSVRCSCTSIRMIYWKKRSSLHGIKNYLLVKLKMRWVSSNYKDLEKWIRSVQYEVVFSMFLLIASSNTWYSSSSAWLSGICKFSCFYFWNCFWRSSIIVILRLFQIVVTQSWISLSHEKCSLFDDE